MLACIEDIPVMAFAYSYKHGNNKRYGCKPGKQTQYNQQGTKEFGKYKQVKRKIFAKAQEIDKVIVVVANLDQLAIACCNHQCAKYKP